MLLTCADVAFCVCVGRLFLSVFDVFGLLDMSSIYMLRGVCFLSCVCVYIPCVCVSMFVCCCLLYVFDCCCDVAFIFYSNMDGLKCLLCVCVPRHLYHSRVLTKT